MSPSFTKVSQSSLAATELAKQYLLDPQTLKEKLALTRWDQALFLTLGLLPSAEASKFLEDVIRADFALALNAVKYVESGRDEIVSRLLSEIIGMKEGWRAFDLKIESALQFRLPVNESHEPQLRELINRGDSLGAATVHRSRGNQGRFSQGGTSPAASDSPRQLQFLLQWNRIRAPSFRYAGRRR